jgi:hypothetical protein
LVGNTAGQLHVIDVDHSKTICTIADPDFTGPPAADGAAPNGESLMSISVTTFSPTVAAPSPRTRYWLTIAVASARRVKVYRVVAGVWQFVVLRSYSAPANSTFNLPVPAGLLVNPSALSPAETGLSPLAVIPNSPLFSASASLSLPLFLHSVHVSSDSARLALAWIDGAVDVFDISVPFPPIPVKDKEKDKDTGHSVSTPLSGSRPGTGQHGSKAAVDEEEAKLLGTLVVCAMVA